MLRSLIALSLVLPALASAQTLYVDEQFGVTHTPGVVFASKPVGSPPVQMDLLLELYQPSGSDVPASRPAILLIHGGGFVGGTRFSSRLIEICERMARRGYTCVSIDYRLAGDDPVIDPAFAPIEDAAAQAGARQPTAVAAAAEDGWAAHQWLLANAPSLGIDADRIGIGGSSAGAVTSLIIAYVLDDIGIAAPNEFKAVFDMWGALGPGIDIDGSDASLLIGHGANDTTVPVSEAYALEAQAIAAGLPHEIYVVPGAGHGFDIFTVLVTPTETMFDRFVAYFYTEVAFESPPTCGLGPELLPVLGLLAWVRRRDLSTQG